MNNTFCAALYKHVNLRWDNTAIACCRWVDPVQQFTGDVSQVLHSDEYVQLRKKIEAGDKLEQCYKCYEDEEQFGFSLRTKFNDKYGTDTTVQVEEAELNLNNICNLACVMCNETKSSQIWKEKNPMLPIKDGIFAVTPVPEMPDTVKKIRFMGGEPLMTSTHRSVLKTVKNLSKVSVEYITNGMFMLTTEDLELLNSCKSAQFMVSIDGYKEVNELTRKGSNWEQVNMFVDELLKNTKFSVTVYTLIHKHSWPGLIGFPEWIEEKQKIRPFRWEVHLLKVPEELSIETLHPMEKEELLKIVQKNNIPDWGKIEKLLLENNK